MAVTESKPGQNLTVIPPARARVSASERVPKRFTDVFAASPTA
jgi:hypothetical protein